MRRNMVARLSLIALAVWACQPAPEAASTKDASTASVEQAKSLAKDLANSAQNYQPVRFVSDIEKVKVPKPVTQPEVEEVVVKGPDSVQVDPMPEPQQVTTPENPPVVAPDSTPVEAPAPRVPTIIPREAPTPDVVGRADFDSWSRGGPGLGYRHWRGHSRRHYRRQMRAASGPASEHDSPPEPASEPASLVNARSFGGPRVNRGPLSFSP